MDQLGLAIKAACAEAQKDLKDEIHNLKVEHHNAIDLFRNRFGELRRQPSGQGERVQVLEQENVGLKAAQQAHVAPPAPVAQTKSASGEDVRKELEQLKKTNYSAKQGLQAQLGALGATQKKQLSMIQALNTKLDAWAGSPGHLKAHAQDLEALKRHQGDFAKRLTGTGAEIAALTRTHRDNKAMSTRLAREMLDCKKKVDEHDLQLGQQHHGPTREHHGLDQQERRWDLEGIKVNIDLLQTAQNDQARKTEALATDRDRHNEVQQGLQTHGIALRHAVNTLKQDSVAHGIRLYSLEDSREMFARSQRQQVALGERIDAALESVGKDIANITAHVDGYDTQAEELREELLTVSRTLLGVIKIVRGSEQGAGQTGEDGVAEVGTISELREHVEAMRQPLRQPTIEPLGDAVMTYGDDEVDPWEQIERLLDEGDRTTEQQDIQEAIEFAPGADDSRDAPLEEPQQYVSTGDPTHPMSESLTTRDQEERTKDQQHVSASQQAAPKRKQHYHPSADGYCHRCGGTESYRWMSGPDGIRTLCDPCGRQYSRLKLQFVALANSDPAPAAPVPDTAREGTPSSSSTLGNSPQKEQNDLGLSEKSLKRKPALSPLKERSDEESAESISAFPIPNSPVAKLAKTGYDIIPGSRRGKGSTMFSAALCDSVENMEKETVSPDGVTAKRKRMNADEKARMMESELVAESGSEDGKKRRRTAVNKTVRFDLDDLFVDMDDGHEENDDAMVISGGSSENKAAHSESRNSDALRAWDSENTTRTTIGHLTTTEQQQAASSPPAKLAGRAAQKAAPTTALNASTNNTTSETAAGFEANLDTTGEPSADSDASHALDHAWDISSDNIVVARPGRSAPRDTEPVSSSSPHPDTRFQPSEGFNGLSDTLGSEDELSLPTRFSPVNARPSYAESSGPGQSTAMKDAGSGEYRTLLSQFNLSNAVQKGGQEKGRLPTSKNGGEGRAKRKPKPKKFDDMVDLRTLTTKDLGE